jgi:hypothetical protein
MFQFMTGATKYKTRQWLTQLSTGDNPFLIEESRMRNLYYSLNPDYSPE